VKGGIPVRAILIAAVTAIASALFVAACSTTPTDEAKPGAVPPGGAAGQEQKPSVATVDLTSKPGAAGINPLKDPNNILSKRSIYFDFDRFEVKAEYRPIVEAHANYLRQNPSAKVLIQGNADERGSREYNVGLGQRRSDSVKKMMTLLGVRESQIEAVSLGEEKPACADHSEECYAKNRRDDVLYSGEY
jgi:peptidoglycan-associated lipoprotein